MVPGSKKGSQTGLQRLLKRTIQFFRSLLTPERRLTLARIMALFVVIGLSIFIFTIRDQAEDLAIYGYPGIFVLNFFLPFMVLASWTVEGGVHGVF